VSEHSTSAQLGPFTLVHAGKYRTEDKLKRQTLQPRKSKTTLNTPKQNKPGLVASYDTRPRNEVWFIEQCFTSPPTQYRLYGRRFLQVKRPNQQYESTVGESCKGNNTKKHK